VKTRQLNRTFAYPSTGTTDNELRAWNHLGLFEPALNERDIAGYARLAPADDAHATLEERARSFIDANCAQCHRPGGVAGLFDARYDTPLTKQNLIDGPVLINLGVDHARLIAPNDIWRSVILARLQTLEQPKMPPLAHEVLDERGAALIAKWIETLPGKPVLAPPALSPPGGEFKTPVTVHLKHPDPNAIIHYTLDGSVPGASAPVYEKPLTITGPATLRASAYKKGATKSITVQETYIVGE
jgi:mono/diheme cytochrome c family protein